MIRPQYDRSGAFVGFSALVAGEWTIPTDYKRLMLAIRDRRSDVLCVPPVASPQPEYAWGGYGLKKTLDV